MFQQEPVMADEKLNQEQQEPNDANYESPRIEEVISPEGLEREVAYAGVVGPSVSIN
jgi:hypothetical protein